MTLQNLAGIGKLKPHKATKEEMSRLHARSFAALMASGFRPSTSEPGHQQTTIQTLPKTIGIAPERMRVFDAYRRARNVADYEGDTVEERLVAECTDAANGLLVDVRAWLKENRPDLL